MMMQAGVQPQGRGPLAPPLAGFRLGRVPRMLGISFILPYSCVDCLILARSCPRALFSSILPSLYYRLVVDVALRDSGAKLGAL